MRRVEPTRTAPRGRGGRSRRPRRSRSRGRSRIAGARAPRRGRVVASARGSASAALARRARGVRCATRARGRPRRGRWGRRAARPRARGRGSSVGPPRLAGRPSGRSTRASGRTMLKSLRHDGRDAAEVAGAKASFEDRTELRHVDPGLEAGRVHLVGGRREDEVDTCRLGLREITAPRSRGYRARSPSLAELSRVHEEAHDDGLVRARVRRAARQMCPSWSEPIVGTSPIEPARRGSSASRAPAIVRTTFMPAPRRVTAGDARGRGGEDEIELLELRVARARMTREMPLDRLPVAARDRPGQLEVRVHDAADERIERLGRRAGRLEQRPRGSAKSVTR